jgi:hypothetical protein
MMPPRVLRCALHRVALSRLSSATTAVRRSCRSSSTGHQRACATRGGGPGNLCPPQSRVEQTAASQRLARTGHGWRDAIRDSSRVADCAANEQTIEFADSARLCILLAGLVFWYRVLVDFPWCLGVNGPKFGPKSRDSLHRVGLAHLLSARRLATSRAPNSVPLTTRSSSGPSIAGNGEPPIGRGRSPCHHRSRKSVLRRVGFELSRLR